MNFIKVKTGSILPPKDNLYPILDKYLPKLKEGDVIFITSKILAIHPEQDIYSPLLKAFGRKRA
jgi:F420-0:gamma-glutamyl ligase